MDPVRVSLSAVTEIAATYACTSTTCTELSKTLASPGASIHESREPVGTVRQSREQLELPDFGERLGGKAVDSHSTGQVGRKTGKTPDADCGKHETTVGKTGKLRTKVKS